MVIVKPHNWRRQMVLAFFITLLVNLSDSLHCLGGKQFIDFCVSLKSQKFASKNWVLFTNQLTLQLSQLRNSWLRNNKHLQPKFLSEKWHDQAWNGTKAKRFRYSNHCNNDQKGLDQRPLVQLALTTNRRLELCRLLRIPESLRTLDWSHLNLSNQPKALGNRWLREQQL